MTGSSPHTQAVGPLHRLAVSQQKAALTSKSFQQPLRGLASYSAVVNSLDLHPLPLHVASVAGAHLCLGWMCNRS